MQPEHEMPFADASTEIMRRCNKYRGGPLAEMAVTGRETGNLSGAGYRLVGAGSAQGLRTKSRQRPFEGAA
jgi:hypothetical protein